MARCDRPTHLNPGISGLVLDARVVCTTNFTWVSMPVLVDPSSVTYFLKLPGKVLRPLLRHV